MSGRNERIVIGLNSGTSVDGIDAVACAIRGRGEAMKVRVIGHVQKPYERRLQERILAVMAPARTHTEEICRLETEIGLAFADAALSLKKRAGLGRIDFVGSHGQTVCHLPPQAKGESLVSHGTLQIGDPAVIAAALDVPVVSHFRQADMADGGQGAPLVPWTDFVLFGDRRRSRIVQNIGGIANMTWLPAGGDASDVLACDCGPGNMVTDGLMRRFTRGREQFDRGGRRAKRGNVRSTLLTKMMRHPFLYREPPKSCGREEFGESWLSTLTKAAAHRRIGPDDWLATATFFTALVISMTYVRVAQHACLDEVILCGGGAKNRTLVDELTHCVRACEGMRKVKFTCMDDYGISAAAKEGVSFAMLAAACVDRVPANLPQVTGASRRVVLGRISNAEARR